MPWGVQYMLILTAHFSGSGRILDREYHRPSRYRSDCTARTKNHVSLLVQADYELCASRALRSFG